MIPIEMTLTEWFCMIVCLAGLFCIVLSNCETSEFPLRLDVYMDWPGFSAHHCSSCGRFISPETHDNCVCGNDVSHLFNTHKSGDINQAAVQQRELDPDDATFCVSCHHWYAESHRILLNGPVLCPWCGYDHFASRDLKKRIADIKP